jgi:2'-hydroxyisoflavone reductase
MRLLVLGGTSFVGRHLVEAALQHGHQVTVFHRGVTNPDLFPQAEHRHGDRSTGQCSALSSGSWDATVDVSAYVPRHVEQAVDALDSRGGHYVLVSSVSAYDVDGARPDEDSRPWPPPAPRTEEITEQTYGPLKAACERTALAKLGVSNVSLVRPTFVVGPHDPTDRFTFWARRMARGGRVPIAWPQAPVQVIDARDLGMFLLTLALHQVAGTFDAVGPWAPLRQFLAALADPDRPYELVEIAPDALAAAGVTLPMVDGDPRTIPLMTRAGSRAMAAGLQSRSLHESATATVAWDRGRGSPPLHAGPTREQEQHLLAAVARG